MQHRVNNFQVQVDVGGKTGCNWCKYLDCVLLLTSNQSYCEHACQQLELLVVMFVYCIDFSNNTNNTKPRYENLNFKID